ncbi:hypothetical protein O0I10_002400 [Lichtheimia ornata]|uniref:Uncharacterized protein n=1 Tax=Lichtheimia ornata TaxID=688661 RepID=A0AAD7VBD9_9FUNG|nr:uncharacterized protein O0I10_002400 [Lichtheimia ornata]KAJ8662068.1 hypothetical protein O0I10_002400 [Lichtheimia ornata]
MWFYNYSIALLVILVSVVSAASSNLPVVNNDRTYATTTTRTVTSHSTIIPPPLSTTHIYMTTVVHEGNYNETLVASFAVSGTALPATLPSYMSSYFLSVFHNMEESVSAILHSLMTASSHSDSISGHIAPPATSLPSPTSPPPHSGV